MSELARGFSREFGDVSQTSFANFRLLLRQSGNVGATWSESEFHFDKRITRDRAS